MTGCGAAATSLDHVVPKALQGWREKMQEFARSLEGKERYIFENRLISDEPFGSMSAR